MWRSAIKISKELFQRIRLNCNCLLFALPTSVSVLLRNSVLIFVPVAVLVTVFTSVDQILDIHELYSPNLLGNTVEKLHLQIT